MTRKLNSQVLVFLLSLCAIPLGVFLILKGGLLYLGVLIIAPFVIVIAFLYPSLLLALLIISTIIQEILFVSVLEIATINQMLGLVLLSVSAVKAITERSITKLSHSITFLLLALLIILVFSFLLFSKGHETPLQDINQYVRSYIYFLICLLVIRNKNDLITVMLAYIVGGMIIMVSGFYWRAIVTPIDYFKIGAFGRAGIRGITGHYIEYAIRCMIPLPILLYLFIEKNLFQKKYFKALILIVIINLSAAILLSGSRGALIAYFFMVAVFAILSKVSIPRKIAIALALFLIPIFLPIGDIVENIVSMVRGNASIDYSASMRKYFLGKLFTDMSLGSIVWGHGLESFRDYYSKMFQPPHSMWGQAFYELGVVGLALQLYLVYKVVQIFQKLRNIKFDEISSRLVHNLTLGCCISIFVLFFWGLYENVGLMLGFKHLFILLGIFIAGSRLPMMKDQFSAGIKL